MSERREPPVGALGEEAVRLLQALQEWARDSTSGGDKPRSGLLSYFEEHIATGGKDCQYCPVCQFIAAVRATSPEVKHHLSLGVSSLFQAAAGLLAPPPPAGRADSDVQRIDLDGDDWEDEDS